MTNPAPLNVPRHLLEAIYNQAREEYPNECCGWLSGDKDADTVSIVKACINVQAQGQHPTAPNRPPETAYVFGAEDLIELNCRLDGDTPPRIIYHSHPNGRAYLSETDRSVATSPWGDGPAYPVQQLVVGLDGQRVVEAALFAWFDDADGFVEVARFEGASI